MACASCSVIAALAPIGERKNRADKANAVAPDSFAMLTDLIRILPSAASVKCAAPQRRAAATRTPARALLRAPERRFTIGRNPRSARENHRWTTDRSDTIALTHRADSLYDRAAG